MRILIAVLVLASCAWAQKRSELVLVLKNKQAKVGKNVRIDGEFIEMQVPPYDQGLSRDFRVLLSSVLFIVDGETGEKIWPSKDKTSADLMQMTDEERNAYQFNKQVEEMRAIRYELRGIKHAAQIDLYVKFISAGLLIGGGVYAIIQAK